MIARWLFAHRASLPHWLRRLLPTPRVACRHCGYMTRHVDVATCSECQDD